jgi:membrane dipeptidase
MKRKHYNGYRSFQYLEPDTDYRAFRLVKEVGRVPAYEMGLTPEQEARARRVFEEHLVISLHDHAFLVPEDLGEFSEYRRQGRDWTGYEGLSQSGLDAYFENFMNGTATITSKAGWKWDDVLYDLGMRLCDLAHQDLVIRAETTDDIRRAKASGQVAMIPSFEAATMIENEVDRLDLLYGFGIRSMGIAYSEANSLGCGLKEARDGGLTELGRQAVRRMNQLGIAIDVSHSGDQTSLDTIEVSEKPIFITHAGARALWNTKRMKPDDVIKACAAKGGVIGIEAAPHTTLTDKHRRHSLESIMEHFEYCANLVGMDHVGFGPDTLFGDHVGLHDFFAKQLSVKHIHAQQGFERVPYVAGIENPAEAMPNIVRWLVQHGYSDEDIARAVGGNAMRVLDKAWWK